MKKNKRYTYQDVKNIVENSNYQLLSKEKDITNDKGFVLAITRIVVKCPYNHIYDVKFYDFKWGYRCKICSGSMKHNIEEVKEYMESFGYELLSTEYKNALAKLLIRCPLGHEYLQSWNNFYNGNRCTYCGGTAKLTYEYVKKYIESFGYELLSDEYKNNKTKLLVQCPNGHKWETRFADFKFKETRCPVCCISKGERRIIEWLDNNNIEYVYEKTYKDLFGLGGGHLSYDFYLPQYNLLIEYQGGFHDGTVTGNYQTDEQFLIRQEHDKRKREYAKYNNINLLEIWYWDFDNIEEILNKELK